MNQVLAAFIKHADFVIKPFDQFKEQLLYTWNSNTSLPLPDGIMRMPYRLHLLLSDWLFGEVVTGYIYIFSILILCYVAMYFFLKRFIRIKSVIVLHISALLFTLNPIYLGNISKIGLQFGIGLLLIMLCCAKFYIDRHKVSYLIVLIICLIGSLVHPFIFIINLGVMLIYLSLNLKAIRVRDVIIASSLFVLLGAYFILPLTHLGSASRAQFETTSTSLDYTALVDIANTDGMLEGMVLSKSVLQDYEFYSPSYYVVYLIGALILVAIIFSGIASLPRSSKYSRIYVACLIAFLLLIALADVSNGLIKSFIVFLIHSPLGWAFRSPLKWQLYIPLVAAIGLSIVLSSYKARYQKIAIVAVAVVLICLNTFIIKDVYDKLLIPKQWAYFSQEHNEFKNKRVMYAYDFTCSQKLSNNLRLTNELDYMLQTIPHRVTYATPSTIGDLNINSYDYVISCLSEINLNDEWHLDKLVESLKIYSKLTSPVPITRATSNAWYAKKLDITALNSNVTAIDRSLALVTNPDYANGEIVELFKDVKRSNFSNGTITTTKNFLHDDSNAILLSAKSIDGDKIIVNGSDVSLDNTALDGQQPYPQTRALNTSQRYTISYSNSNSPFKNLLDNSSFESGMWKQDAEDCYDYDRHPDIDMSLVGDAAHGKSALRLFARNHIACTHTTGILLPLEASNMFISFKAKALQGDKIRVLIKYNDPDSTSFGHDYSSTQKHEWQEYAFWASVPARATSFDLYIYASPEMSTVAAGELLYDDFFITQTPDIINKLYLFSSSVKPPSSTNVISEQMSPTRYKITLTNIDNIQSDYFILDETYHTGWKILDDTQQVAKHVVLHTATSDGLNMWKFDNISSTQQNISFFVEFTPQRYFNIGLVISGTTLAGCIGYLVYDYAIRPRRKTYHTSHAK